VPAVYFTAPVFLLQAEGIWRLSHNANRRRCGCGVVRRGPPLGQHC